MQLENFARQVFVDAELTGWLPRAVRFRVRKCAPGLAPGGELREFGVLADRILIVEKGDHGGVLLHRRQQIDKAAADMRPNRLVLESAGDAGNRPLVRRHRKVIGPKVHQAFRKRPRGEGGALGSCQNLRPVVG